MTELMGVVNVTPDSFSDGGDFVSTETAIAHGHKLVSLGATIIDVGGESTRPGATPVPREEELTRVLPVIRALSDAGIRVSIDTLHAETAQAAVQAGAAFINDVSGALHDPDMLEVAAQAARTANTGLIIGHWRGVPDPAHTRSHYADVVNEVREALAERAAAALAAGVPRELIVLDPGLGFDKTGEQGWEILRRLDEIRSLGYPVLVGISRKRMLADVLAQVPGAANAPHDRDLATAVATALSVGAGAWGVRVHDVHGSAQAIAVQRAWSGDRSGETSPTVPESVPASAPAQAAAAMEHAFPTDQISLTGLEVFAHHGVFDFERERGQRFIVDIGVAVDLSAASADDDLARTVHYGELAEAVVAAVSRDPVDLIETVAERVAAVALGFPAVARVVATIHKPDAPIDTVFRDVSVTVVRERGAE